jgi:hypothetical protein
MAEDSGRSTGETGTPFTGTHRHDPDIVVDRPQGRLRRAFSPVRDAAQERHPSVSAGYDAVVAMPG